MARRQLTANICQSRIPFPGALSIINYDDILSLMHRHAMFDHYHLTKKTEYRNHIQFLKITCRIKCKFLLQLERIDENLFRVTNSWTTHSCRPLTEIQNRIKMEEKKLETKEILDEITRFLQFEENRGIKPKQIWDKFCESGVINPILQQINKVKLYHRFLQKKFTNLIGKVKRELKKKKKFLEEASTEGQLIYKQENGIEQEDMVQFQNEYQQQKNKDMSNHPIVNNWIDI